MTPEQLTDLLKNTLGGHLKSVVLYGSAAAGDRTKKYSDVNILTVVDDMGLPTMKAATPIVNKWVRDGNPAPLFFTEERIHQAEDVFPIEFLDIKANHKMLYGPNPFENLRVNTEHLRHQLEYELRGKLIQLRKRYMEIAGKRKPLQELLGRSLSTFTVLFKGVLKLVGAEVPSLRLEVFEALNQHVVIDVEVLKDIHRIREGLKAELAQDPDDLLSRLLRTVERVVDFVDGYKGR